MMIKLKMMQQQVGHSHASTTALYTSVSDEFRNRLLDAASARFPLQEGPDFVTKRMSIAWHLRIRMAEKGLFQTSGLVPLLAERGVQLSASRSTGW